MKSLRPEYRTPKPADSSGIVSWVHFGDLHITTRPEQNYGDFVSLIEEVNRVKAWSEGGVVRGYVAIGDQKLELEQLANSAVWQAMVNTGRLPDGIARLTAHCTDENGKTAQDTIRVRMNRSSSRFQPATRLDDDSDNAIGSWPEHGIPGAQLGPNKNGRH